MGCKYNIDMDIPANIRIETADLSSLLINVFDNAIEAISIYMKSDKKKKRTQYHLMAKAYKQDDRLIIRVENVKSSKQKKRDSSRNSAKQNSKGLLQRKELLKKQRPQRKQRLQKRRKQNLMNTTTS